MKQFLTVLKFELNNYFKNRSFLLTTILLMVLAVGIIVVPGLIMGGGSDSHTAQKGSGDREAVTVAFYDAGGSITDTEVLGTAMGMDVEWLECRMRIRWRKR